MTFGVPCFRGEFGSDESCVGTPRKHAEQATTVSARMLSRCLSLIPVPAHSPRKHGTHGLMAPNCQHCRSVRGLITSRPRSRILAAKLLRVHNDADLPRLNPARLL